jgi:hypothetical protein
MIARTLFSTAILSLSLLGACAQNVNRDVRSTIIDPKSPVISGQGTVRYTDVEGGAYLIDSSMGTLIPVGLDANLAQDGLEIEFKAHKLNNSVSYLQSGTLVQIVSAQAL